MRLGYDRDVDDEGIRLVRRRPLRPEARDWYGANDVSPYSMPYRPRFEEVQRPDKWTPRGHARSVRSLDAYPPKMPPPPSHLTRASTEAYRRRPGFSRYEDEEEEESDERWRPAKPREPVKERVRRRRYTAPKPEPEPELSEPLAPESVSPSETGESSVTSETDSEDEEEEEEEEEEDDDDSDSDSESDSDSGVDDEVNQIEVVVEEASESEHKHRHRHHRHLSRDIYNNSSSDDKRRWRRSRMPSSSSSDDIEVTYRQASSEQGLPTYRPPLRREVSDNPRQEFPPRYPSVIGNSRPPVASRRTAKAYEAAEVGRDGRTRRPPTQNMRPSRSSSRRPTSTAEAVYEDTSRTTSQERPANLRDCKVCMDEVPASRCPKLPCGHAMCYPCLKKLFKMSITDPKQMPPRCCTVNPIPLSHVEDFVDPMFKKIWNRKFADYAMRNRLYCPSTRCGEWIRPINFYNDSDTGRRAARCDRCNTKVCVVCNGRWHFSKDCPRDDETGRFLEYARHEGWKRCYRCSSTVEIKDGYNHATCRCGAAFCMLCGLKPKKCECPWFTCEQDEPDEPDHMSIPTPLPRRKVEGIPRATRSAAPAPTPAPAPEEPRSSRKTRPSTRPRSQIYDEEELMRQKVRQQQEELAQRPQYYRKEDDYADRKPPKEKARAKKAPKRPKNVEPKRTGRRVVGASSPDRPGYDKPPTGFERPPVGFGYDKSSTGFERPPSGFERPPSGYERPSSGYDRAASGAEYLSSGDRSRTGRGGSMERRLADRFSESRHMSGALPTMDPPGMNPHMGPALMPPPIGMPPPLHEGMYPGGGMGAHERVIVEHDPNVYDDGDTYYSHRSRNKRHGQRSESPRSSELAGLIGRGTGMGRVDVWRKSTKSR